MSTATMDAAARQRLRVELEAVPGVRRALIDDDPTLQVYVVCDPSDATPSELLVRSVLARSGLSPGQVDLQVCHAPTPQPRRRVRFMSARVESPRVGRSRAAVALEWAGETFAEELEGESGHAAELRLAAMATLRTLEAVLQGTLSFRLVGIKSVRAFDAEIVVALLHTGEDPGRTLVGASLATESPHRSAALAVLNATNRCLGNYLAHLDGGVGGE